MKIRSRSHAVENYHNFLNVAAPSVSSGGAVSKGISWWEEEELDQEKAKIRSAISEISSV